MNTQRNVIRTLNNTNIDVNHLAVYKRCKKIYNKLPRITKMLNVGEFKKIIRTKMMNDITLMRIYL